MNLAPLAPLYERSAPWASAYLDTAVADESAAERRALQARRIRRELADLGADEETCRAVGEAVESYAWGAGAAGHAVFASHGEVVLDPPLTVRPSTETSADWGPLPHVAPLLELVPDEPDCLIAYIDRTGADIELRTATDRRSLGQVSGRTWPVHRTATADWSERHFQLSVENAWEENARKVAGELRDCVARTGAELVVLAGDERGRASVHQHLSRRPQAVVVETGHGGRAAGSSGRLLDADVAAARQEYLGRRTAEEISHFEAARSPSGGHVDAAEGVPALVRAAREHRIDRLFVVPDGPDAHRSVWAGAEPDQIALRRGETRYLGESEPFATRADDALLRSAAMTGADAVLVTHAVPGVGGSSRGSDTAGGSPVGGLGALLRWPYGDAAG